MFINQRNYSSMLSSNFVYSNGPIKALATCNRKGWFKFKEPVKSNNKDINNRCSYLQYIFVYTV